MPFKVAFLSSYARSFKKLGSREQWIAGLIVFGLEGYFAANLPPTGEPFTFLFQGRNYRLVFKKLRGSLWEAYVESRVRIVTRLEDDCHFLLLVGNHDQVRQFLKKN